MFLQVPAVHLPWCIPMKILMFVEASRNHFGWSSWAFTAPRTGQMRRWSLRISWPARCVKRWEGWEWDHLKGFLKWWVSPTTMGFPTKNDHFGVEIGGYHHLRKHPFGDWITGCVYYPHVKIWWNHPTRTIDPIDLITFPDMFMWKSKKGRSTVRFAEHGRGRSPFSSDFWGEKYHVFLGFVYRQSGL